LDELHSEQKLKKIFVYDSLSIRGYMEIICGVCVVGEENVKKIRRNYVFGGIFASTVSYLFSDGWGIPMMSFDRGLANLRRYPHLQHTCTQQQSV
jgi:hypothetical protein